MEKEALKKEISKTVEEMELAYGFPVQLKVLNNQYIKKARECGFATVKDLLEEMQAENSVKICILPRRGARVILPMASYIAIEESPNNTLIHHLAKYEDFLKNGPAPLEPVE